MRAPWLEPHDEFQGVGAHELNDRYDPVDERAAGFTVQDTDPLLMHTPALIVARRASVAATRLDGADISHHQYDAGPVSLIRTRYDPPTTWFATKVTQSISYLDPTASASRTAARIYGFRAVGLYHWLSSTTDPAGQAVWFLARIGALRPGEFAMLDAEEAGITAADCLVWCETVEAVTRRPAAVYTGAYVTGGTIWQDSGLRRSRYGRRPFILAAYTTEAKARALPGVAAYRWSSWQYSSSGPVPGITGRCDMNRVDDWAAYDLASGVSMPVPIPVVTPAPEPMEDDDDMVALFTHSDTDHEGHPPRWTYWALVGDGGTKRHINEAELAIRGGRDTAPAIPMALVDTIPDAPGD